MLKNTIKKATKAISSKFKEISNDELYNYSTKQSRENTVAYLLLYADGQRSGQVKKWETWDNYYNNKHVVQAELYKYCVDKNIPWVPAIIPDPYIHVESQINPDMPEFEFSGRDDDRDSEKAKQRQYVVQYILDNNDMPMKNNRNERRMNKLGNAIWKVGYNHSIRLPKGVHGDIFIDDIDCMAFVNDPVALDLDDGEYHDYVYRIHRMKAARVFKNELDKLNMKIEDIGAGSYIKTTLFNTQTYDENNDTVQVVEHWFRQPVDGSEKYTYTIDGKEVTETVEWEAGDIACSIQINNKEIKYIPLYWIKTHKQNKMYPFSMGCKIAVENYFWDKSEIEPIKELVDAADRELATTILNDTFMGNDIIIMPENVLADSSELINEPGALWLTKPGTPANSISRLGGLGGLNGGFKDTINFLREIIKQTVGNFDVNMGGAPPGNIKTLGGLIQLKEQGNTRQNKKRAGSIAMWERLIKLIDYTAIEFYDDNRLIFLGANKNETNQQSQKNSIDMSQGSKIFQYNSDYLKMSDENGDEYYPIVDYKVIVGDGITNSPAMTIEATQQLAQMPVNMENKEIVKSLTDLMKLPNRHIIKKSIDDFFANQATSQKDKPNITIAFKDLPIDAQSQLLEQIGIRSKGGLSPEMEIEKQKNQADAQSKGVNIEQSMQAPELDPQDVLKGLSQEELAHLQQNPQLLDSLMQGGQ